MTTEPKTPTTPEQLDEMRARALADYFNGESGSLECVSYPSGWINEAEAIRRADEAAGIPTEGLLAVMRGEAVIVPRKATMEMKEAAWKFKSIYGSYLVDAGEAMIVASPWAPKKDKGNG